MARHCAGEPVTLMAKSKNRLVWIDCEMTGLEPERHVLLEIATIITDDQLEIVEEGPVIAVHQSDAVLRRMDSWCRRQHKKSGLTDRVRASRVSTSAAEMETLKFVRRHCLIRQAPVCGNSIGHDRKFLNKYMPKLHSYFHYQSIDVSSIKQVVARWYGKRYKAPEKAEQHLALPDIKESIEELKFYRKHVFVKK